MDIESANIEPYRRYHDFHERFNVNLKVLTAYTIRTASYLSSAQCPEKLGDLIIAADPAWKMPPVWEHNSALLEASIGSVTNLGIVSVYSAVDDFLVGLESEISRWEGFSGIAMRVGTLGETDDPDCRFTRILRRYDWFGGIRHDAMRVLRYFDLVRNCIAHRDARASRALEAVSKSPAVRCAYSAIFERPNHSLPEFQAEEEIRLHPTFAIFYSHLARSIATRMNTHLLSTIGADGILVMAIHHLCCGDFPMIRTWPRNPEAGLNAALSDRYRVILADKMEAAGNLRRLKLWKRFAEDYKKAIPTK